jgi:putative hydroxymethylpyrimidine transport system ATP-binding protein
MGQGALKSKSPALHFHGSAAIAGTSIFDPLDLDIAAGKWTCLLGASGVGKTTVLRLLAGLGDHIDHVGSIKTSDGQSFAGRISLMAQTDNLMPWLDVFDNIVIGSRLRGDAVNVDRAEKLIEQVGLTAHRHKKPNALSGGQRQRVALARTLMEGRPIVLLDEPFSALDAKIRAEMQDLAARLFAGKTVCLITHDPGEAARLGDVIFVMNVTGLHSVTPPSSPVIRPYDAPDVLACLGQLLRLLRETP